jgi:hypothetical protein
MTGGLEGLLAGRTLVKRYRIQEVIGRGGFAVVYQADDLRLGRPTAVKVLALAAPTPEAREQIRARFEREARSAASLPHHPNVVPVYDFGTDAELGIDFIVMELLRGENVAAYLEREGRPPLPLSLRIIRDAAEGLAVGHRAKLIHRDVKPGNLFLAEPQGEQPFRVCVLDFGIARVMDEDEENSLTRTRGGLPLSPAYASPEQLRGDRELSAASDVFSLGVVGYQLLTGEKPFDQDRVPGVTESIRPVRALNPQVPAAVEAVIARATHPDPARRYADADAFAAALDAAVDGDDETVLAAPAPIREEEDDRTVLAPAAAAVVIPAAVAAEPVRAPAPEPAPVPRSAPATATAVKTKKRTPAWMIVLAVLLVVGAAGVWAMSGGGGDAPKPTAAAPADSADDDSPAPEPGDAPVTAETPATDEKTGIDAPVEGSPEPAGEEPSAPPASSGETRVEQPVRQQPAPRAQVPAPTVQRQVPQQPRQVPQQPRQLPRQPRPTVPRQQPVPQQPRQPVPQPPAPQPQPQVPPPLPPEPLPPPPNPYPTAPRDTIVLPSRPVEPTPTTPPTPTGSVRRR